MVLYTPVSYMHSLKSQLLAGELTSACFLSRCVRNINVTHNYLYCEYVTGMITYFDLRVDPHQAGGAGVVTNSKIWPSTVGNK